MIASFFDNKKYDLFLNVAKKLKNYDVTFIGVGDGPLFERIKQRITFEKIENALLLGKQKNVEQIIAASDVGVLFTYTEGISNAILEYVAMGKPVITNDVLGGSKEIIENEGIGYIIDNENEIVEKLKELLSNQTLRKTMGENGKKLIKDKFSIERMGEEYMQMYNLIW